MNQHIEDYLAELVGNLGNDIEVFTGTSSDVRTPELHAVLVLADQVEGVVGNLYKATVKVSISSPADGSTRSAHMDIVDDVRDAFTEPLPSAQSLGITAIEVRGFHITNHNAGVSDDGRWVTSIEALIGVTRL
jgi:hypothetical protein